MTQFWPFSPKMRYLDLKWPILTKLNPLMTFLTTVKLINLAKTTFATVLRKKYFLLTPKIRPTTSFLPPKWTKFYHFCQKWPNLTKLTPLMIVLTNVMIKNVTEIIFETVWCKNIFVPPKNFDLWRNFGSQNDPILTIFTKTDLFWPN